MQFFIMLSMKIKKLQWINKPRNARILNGHELTAKADGEHVLVYTFADDEVIEAIFTTATEYGLYLIISPQAGLSISWKEGVLTSLTDILGVKCKEFHYLEESNRYTVEKRGGTLIFSYGGKEIKTFSFDNTKDSVSLGFFFKGKGDIKIHL